MPKFNRKGYEYVEVSHDGKKKKFSVHRLVATAFCKNPNNHREVNQIDGNPMNNHADNLEWVSGSENQLHSRYVLGNQTGFKDRPVICVETNQHFISTRDAWRATGARTSHICEAAAGKRKLSPHRRHQCGNHRHRPGRSTGILNSIRTGGLITRPCFLSNMSVTEEN